jgi:hypothetical protein
VIAAFNEGQIAPGVSNFWQINYFAQIYIH